MPPCLLIPAGVPRLRTLSLAVVASRGQSSYSTMVGPGRVGCLGNRVLRGMGRGLPTPSSTECRLKSIREPLRLPSRGGALTAVWGAGSPGKAMRMGGLDSGAGGQDWGSHQTQE